MPPERSRLRERSGVLWDRSCRRQFTTNPGVENVDFGGGLHQLEKKTITERSCMGKRKKLIESRTAELKSIRD